MNNILEEELLLLYREPAIGASYTNTYGEENIMRLVEKYRALDKADREAMLEMVVRFSQSPDLASSFVSVGVLHALGRVEDVEAAYRWAEAQEDGQRLLHHFDIGKSVAEYFAGD